MNQDYCETLIAARRRALGLYNSDAEETGMAIRLVLQQIIQEYIDQGQLDTAAQFLLHYNMSHMWGDYAGYPGIFSLLKTVSNIYEERGEATKLRAMWKRAFLKSKSQFWYWCPLPSDTRPRGEQYYANKRQNLLFGEEYMKVLERYGPAEELAAVKEQMDAMEDERRTKRKGKPDPRKINEDLFWELIEECGKDDDVAHRLTGRLEGFKPREIVNFKKIETRLMRRAYRWDLWAVAFIMMSGCGDDAFEYFRAWLIGRGRKHFEAALQDPEKAADGVEQGDQVENEAMLSVAENAYLAVAKAGGEDFMEKVAPAADVEVQGAEWKEEDLPKMFPRLCERFGYMGASGTAGPSRHTKASPIPADATPAERADWELWLRATEANTADAYSGYLRDSQLRLFEAEANTLLRWKKGSSGKA